MDTNLIFNNLHIIPISITKPLTEDDLVKAITLNENIKSTYGYTFKPEDIVKIAKSDTNVWDIISNVIPDVKGTPMYPNFPTQVMEMDEAMYRFHQAIHYFSTYGLEALFGVEVNKGWMPDVEATEKIKEDKSLFDVKVIEVVTENLEKKIVTKIAEKKARMTSDERVLVAEAIQTIVLAGGSEWVKSLSISFKENLKDIFLCVVDTTARIVAKDILKNLCQHTGDVLKCIKYYLGMHRYKISTSQKKLFVKLLEEYSISDFKENIMFSNMRREEIITTLQYLDYNTFSRSYTHKEAVRELRNDELTSWYGEVEKAFKEDINKALVILSKRPGELLRRINEALNRGLSKDSVLNALEDKDLSLPTLVRLNTFFDSSLADERENKEVLVSIFRRLLFNYFVKNATPLKDKKVFIEEGVFDFDNSTIEINDRSNMSGYVRSGIAYKIPGDAKIVRFFTYWNDKKRVDIDLHARGLTKDKEEIHVGWNGDYKSKGVCMSGDITHSDAAEFIDVDLENTVLKNIAFFIQDFTKFGFNEIETVLCGVMGVSKLGVEKDYKLYTPKNCFFSNEIKENTTDLYYGYMDTEKRFVKFVGKNNERYFPNEPDYSFTLTSYLNTLAHAQGVEFVKNKDEADIVLKMDKGVDERDISLIDENFFLEI